MYVFITGYRLYCKQIQIDKYTDKYMDMDQNEKK